METASQENSVFRKLGSMSKIKVFGFKRVVRMDLPDGSPEVLTFSWLVT
jgi:hypothetical protein